MQEIPLQPIPGQRLQIVLAEQYCTFHVYYRYGRCYCDLTVDDDVVFKGFICQNLARVNQSPSNLFSGAVVFVDTLGDMPPQWYGLGDRWQMLYLTDDEADEAGI